MRQIEVQGKMINAIRVYGGVSPAGEGPGYADVFAEEQYEVAPPISYAASPTMGKRYRLVDEIATWDVAELIARCAEFAGRYGATFYGRNSFKGLKEYLNLSWRRGTPFTLVEAPSTDDKGNIRFHINVLQDVLRKGSLDRKEIEGSILYHNLHKMDEGETAKATDIKFPTIAGAGYALSALEVLQGFEEESRMVEMMLEEEYGEWDD
jgi:hypothetical protein